MTVTTPQVTFPGTSRSDNAVTSPPLLLRSALGQPVTVVPRQLCQFRIYRLRSEGRAGLEAVRLKARHELLEGRKGGLLLRSTGRDGEIGVWAFPWIGAPESRHLPETLARTPGNDGTRLVRCLDGVEGESWKNGSVSRSRWWAKPPDATEWSLFLRAAFPNATSLETLPPRVQALGWRKDIAPFRLSRARVGHLLSPARLSAIGGLIGLVSLAWVSGQWIAASAEARRAQADVATLTPSSQATLSYRRRALGTLGTALSESVPVAPTALADAFVALDTVLRELVPDTEPRLRNFRLDGDRLEMSVFGLPGVEITELIGPLEATSALSQVSVTTLGRDGVRVAADLAPSVATPAVPVDIIDEAEVPRADGREP